MDLKSSSLNPNDLNLKDFYSQYQFKHIVEKFNNNQMRRFKAKHEDWFYFMLSRITFYHKSDIDAFMDEIWLKEGRNLFKIEIAKLKQTSFDVNLRYWIPRSTITKSWGIKYPQSMRIVRTRKIYHNRIIYNKIDAWVYYKEGGGVKEIVATRNDPEKVARIIQDDTLQWHDHYAKRYKGIEVW